MLLAQNSEPAVSIHFYLFIGFGRLRVYSWLCTQELFLAELVLRMEPGLPCPGYESCWLFYLSPVPQLPP